LNTTAQYDRKKVISWALYDWANSAFSTTVVAGFFPVFFEGYWSAEVTATESTYRLGAANSLLCLGRTNESRHYAQRARMANPDSRVFRKTNWTYRVLRM